LAIVNEVYLRFRSDFEALLEDSKKRTAEKRDKLLRNEYTLCNFSEFGMRRRLCAEAQEYAVKEFSERLRDNYHTSYFVGTSNVYLAKKYNIKPVGTMAHEWIMCMGQGHHLYNPAYSNKVALDAWIKEYGVDNGIALTDTITTDCFLRDFDKPMATLFSGVRHDSGDPIEWGKKILKHYKKLGIDPKTKTLLFSDSLNFEKATEIANYFKDRTNVAFGIGTYISNDTYAKPLNIVMKVTNCNHSDVAKISDTIGKGMCKNQDYVNYLRKCIDWRLEHE
jgi:nicotinate phosphoribosyltransferase